MSAMTWYYATNPRATFAFAIDGDTVAVCAPWGRKWLLGRSKDEARHALRRGRYQVVPLRCAPSGSSGTNE